LGGGYIGGNDYNSGPTGTIGYGPGTVTISAMDFDRLTNIAGQVYVQIIQGATLVERYTNASGDLSVSLDPLPIDELTMGYKCGAVRCNKASSAAAYNDYAFVTQTQVDSLDANILMKLMSNAATQGGPLRTPNGGRYRATVTGTVPTSMLASYVYPNPGIQRARPIFLPPTKLRAALVVYAFRDISVISAGLDGILLPANTETSVSICMKEQGTPAWGIRYATKTSLPPNLVAPEILRSLWYWPCATWTTNPGNTAYQMHAYTPGQSLLIWNIGAYANATNFSLSGGIDLFSFPLAVCGLGLQRVAIPATLSNGNWTSDIGTNANFYFDIREDFPGLLGYDPDTATDRRVTVIMNPNLPVDPARRDARLSAWWGSFANGYKIPNRTDSRLGAGWDTRFYRKNAIVATGADYGSNVGMGVTGLALSTLINDPLFTMFSVGYMQSAVGSGSGRMGARNLQYWSGSAATHQMTIVQAGPNSGWTDSEGNVNFAPTETGGPANYAAIGAISRGQFSDTMYSDRTNEGGGGLSMSMAFNPGSLVTVYHVGPFQSNHTVYIADYLNMPNPITPAADAYIYPAPQDSSTPGSGNMNRNGEMMPDRSVDADNRWMTYSSANPNFNGRYYFQINQPGWLNQTARAVHAWQVSVSEPGLFSSDGATATGFYGKASQYQRIISDDGAATVAGATQWLTNADYARGDKPRFLNQGVQVGDSIWFNSRQSSVINCRCRIGAVEANRVRVLTNAQGSSGAGCQNKDGGAITNGCTFSSTGMTGDTEIQYRIFRAAPRGECVIDQNFYGGVSDTNGNGGCKDNTFWTAYGPVSGTGNITILFPRVVKGARTLGGTAGTVPDILDGITSTLGNNPNLMLNWTFSLFAYNTGAVTQGGLGRQFTWNNRDLIKTELLTHQAATDSKYFLYQ
jgi:hypothetical protein